MYGSTGGLTTGGVAGGVLAATGGGGPWLALFIGVGATAIGLLLVMRRRLIERRRASPALDR